MDDSDFGKLLEATGRGDSDASELLVQLTYEELKSLAHGVLAAERGSCSLQSTMLVHDVWVQLAGNVGSFESRRHFFGAAARAMRRLLIDHARSRNATKRGGDILRVTFSDCLAQAPEAQDVSILALQAALDALTHVSASAAQVIELRYFAGLTLEEVARVQGVSLRTVKREWTYARAWLHERLRKSEHES